MENKNELNTEPEIRSAESTPQSAIRNPQSDILIVEDGPVEAELLRRVLAHSGYQATWVKNGEEGLQALREHPYVLVISDIQMPLMNGYELCRAIKLDEKLWDTPVILVTMLSEPKDIIKALEAGADSYITKPYIDVILLGRISSLLANPFRRKFAEERRKIQVEYGGESYNIAASGQLVANMLFSVYENSMFLNHELLRIQNQLNLLNNSLDEQVLERTAALQKSEEKFRKITESAQDAIIMMGNDQRISFWNTAAEHIFGYNAAEAVGHELHALIVPALARSKFVQAFPHFQASGKGAIIGKMTELTALRKGGEEFPVELSVSATQIGGQWHAIGIVRDITQRKINEVRIARLNRIYSVLSGINTTIVRVHDEDELFSEACRIAVEHGHFTFVWIGKFDADKQQLRPVARAGRDDGYLAQINLTTREGTKGSCALTTQALTEAKPAVCNDIASDERMAAWRSEALGRGYRSVTVFPLVVEERPVGIFALYASEPGVFDDEEMKLLVEMSGDISFAIDNINKKKKLNYLAYYDVITSLPNRTLFYDRLDQHLHDAAQNGKTTAVLAIDLERFRAINETFGRHLGDVLLKQVAERLMGTGVGVNHLAHISSDCFAVVLPNVREEADVMHFLENQITAVLSKPFQLEGQGLHISIKAGIALFPADGKDADTLFRNAEAALIKTKLSGDKYLFYTPEFNARIADRLKLENKLRIALEQKQLVLHYQPKVDLKSNQIIGLEALLRWNDPENGMVSPVKFIPVLEETGMIIEAGAWALAQAMADYCAWQAKGLASPRIAVNVSQVQLQRSDFVNTIERVVSSLGGVTSGLEIEITESLIMQNAEVNIKKLHAIREMGIEVAIDDFGTGYSSLSYIAKLPINSLKIDRAFIINMTSNADDLSIVSAIISLAHSLNLRVIAEGVETNEQAKLLRLLKCDEIQGFLFSPGVPAEQIEEFLRNKKALE